MGLKTPNRRIFSDAIDFYTNGNEIGTVEDIDVNLLVPFHNHPFKLYEGERLNDMVESIKENGILTPVIVRRYGENYEILAGHNRTNAAKLAGLSSIPCIVKEKLSDEEAYVYVIETNMMQRSFNDLRVSEKALVLSERYDNIKSQGKRNDIIRELKYLNGEITTEEYITSNREDIASEYKLSGATMARLLRINKLINELKEYVDDGKLPLLSAVNLSYLNTDMQKMVYDIANEYGVKISESLSKELREKGDCELKEIMSIMIKPKSSVPYQKIRVPVGTYERYFVDKKPKEVEEIIIKALDNYFKDIRLEIP